jgi:hypothetical protein
VQHDHRHGAQRAAHRRFGEGTRGSCAINVYGPRTEQASRDALEDIGLADTAVRAGSDDHAQHHEEGGCIMTEIHRYGPDDAAIDTRVVRLEAPA